MDTFLNTRLGFHFKQTLLGLFLIALGPLYCFAQNNKSESGLIQTIYEFAKTSAVTGREDEAAHFIETLLPDMEIKEDHLGNLVIEIGSGQPKRLLTAPLDEPGYVISKIQKNGYMRLTPAGFGHVGNLYDQFLEGHEVKINTAEGPVIGVSTVPSMHFEGMRAVPERSKKPFKWQEAYIDVGASSNDEVLQKGIRSLDPITLNKKPVLIDSTFLAAPSIKSKAAAIALAAVAHSLKNEKVEGTIVIAWTTLELINGKGLETIINKRGPFEEVYRFNRFLESDQAGANKLLSNRKLPTAGNNNITSKPSQPFRNPASTIDFSGQNIYEIGLPALYNHTPIETVAISDVQHLIAYWQHITGAKTSAQNWVKGTLESSKESYSSFKDEHALLSKLVAAYGVSSDEGPVRNLILKKLPAWASPKVDAKGNIILTFGKGSNHKVFVAHMDETGYAVDDIAPDGKLVLKSRGGMLPWLWEAQPAIIHAKGSEIHGVFEPRPNYKTAIERASHTPLIVNAGFKSKDEAIANGIEIGTTTVTMPKKMIRLSETKATARGFDDRVGCAALLLSLKNLDPASLNQKITFVWSVEEEIGLFGSTYAAKSLNNADIVYPIDTYVSSDDPYSDVFFADQPLGKGAVIRVLESISFVNREHLKRMQKLASENNINIQYGMTAGGTDGQAFLGYDIPSIPLSWPGRYSHSPIELMDYRDMNNLVSLIKVLLKETE